MTKITKIETTRDKISGRGGITFFLRYVQQTGFFGIALSVLGFVCISRKGLSLKQFLNQMLAYFIDGTDMSGFFDQKAFDYFEQVLRILYVVTGKIYPKTKEYIKGVDTEQSRSFGTVFSPPLKRRRTDSWFWNLRRQIPSFIPISAWISN